MKAYDKTSNGLTTRISLAEGLEIINYCQMDGSRFVKSMSQISKGSYEIVRKGGDTTRLVQVEVEEPSDAEEWSVTRAGSNIVHRFNPETLVGRCNKSYRPQRCGGGYSLRTRSATPADLYTFCPKCAPR